MHRWGKLKRNGHVRCLDCRVVYDTHTAPIDVINAWSEMPGKLTSRGYIMNVHACTKDKNYAAM